MTSPFNGFIPVSAYLPLIYTEPKLFELEPTLTDKYDSFYKHLGIDRCEMPLLQPGVARVDILAGTRIDLKYIE